ncbi:MAG: sulfotransferase domain-containing protein [bacterium]|nr:sulfotransferase domain-containing protein [bacterium]
MRIPNFFIVGHHKSGASPLRDFLDQHPDIYFPEQEELHHFEGDLIQQRLKASLWLPRYLRKRLNIEPEDYLEHYRDSGSQRIIGDNTPSYLGSETSAREIYNFNPQAKIIALFNEPVSYIYSLHSRNLYDRFEKVKDFGKALALEEARKNGKKIPIWGKPVPHMLFYRERINYTEQLLRFLKLFPLDQVKFIISDDLKYDSRVVLQEVLRFLQVDHLFTLEFKKVNPNKRRRYGFGTIKRLVSWAAKTVLPLRVRVRNHFRLIHSAFDPSVPIYEPPRVLDPELERQLKLEFKEEVIRFNQMLHEYGLLEKDQDLLEIWGYDKLT